MEMIPQTVMVQAILQAEPEGPLASEETTLLQTHMAQPTTIAQTPTVQAILQAEPEVLPALEETTPQILTAQAIPLAVLAPQALEETILQIPTVQAIPQAVPVPRVLEETILQILMVPATKTAQTPTAQELLVQTTTDPRTPALVTETPILLTLTVLQVVMTVMITTHLPRKMTLQLASSWRRLAVRSKTREWSRRDSRSVPLLVTMSIALETLALIRMDRLAGTMSTVLPTSVIMTIRYNDKNV